LAEECCSVRRYFFKADDGIRVRNVTGVQTCALPILFARRRLDVIMPPTTPGIAPVREHTTVDIGGRPEPVAAALPRFTAWASATGMPAISVPVWPHSASRLPAGIQIMAPPHHEHMCVRAAQLIEKLLIENSVGRTTP